jgi:hypothetical protein
MPPRQTGKKPLLLPKKTLLLKGDYGKWPVKTYR